MATAAENSGPVVALAADGTRTTAAHDPMVIASFPPVIAQNPYQRLLYTGLAEFGFTVARGERLTLGWLVRQRDRVRILHFHWLQAYYVHNSSGRSRTTVAMSWLRLGLFAARIVAARSLGYRLAWTIHQIYPHESISRQIDRLAARLVARASHVLLAHDIETARSAEAELALPRGTVAVVAHGSYVGVYPRRRPRQAIRRDLGFSDEEFVFLSFGHVRGYKHIELLVEAFTATRSSLPNARLVIAGMALDGAAAVAINAAAVDDPRITPVLRFVPDESVADLFAASDVAVLARGDGGTSGALILALSLGKPVVAASAPTYAEIVDGAGWLFPPKSPHGLATQLRAAVEEGHAGARRRGQLALDRARGLSWSDSCAAVASLLKGACM